MNKRIQRHLALIGMAVGLLLANRAIAGDVVTDFSSFSESQILSHGVQVPSPNNPDSVSMTFVSEVGATRSFEQTTYMSDAFATLAVGDRISVNWTAIDWGNDGGTWQANDQFGLAFASSATPGERVNLVTYVWYPSPKTLEIRAFNEIAGTTAFNVFGKAAPPDTLFIERTASGWSFGQIDGGVESYNAQNITAVGAVNITADGSAFGVYSDMRNKGGNIYQPRTLSNLTVPPPPPPTGTMLIVQ